MRICFVADGASIHTRRWVEHLARSGHEVHLITSKPPSGPYAGVNTHLLTGLPGRDCLATRYPNVLLQILQTRRLVKKLTPDIVDGQFLTGHGFLAACSGYHPLVVTAWGSDLLVQPWRNPLQKLAARYTLNRSDALVCRIPVEAATDLVDRLGADSGKVIRRIVLGVNTAEFTPARRDDKVRTALGSEGSQPIIISTRSLAPIYDVEMLIRAASLVLTQVPETRFVIAGTGKQRDRLKKLALDLGVSDSTEFLGWVPRSELPLHLASAEVYVSTSLSDGTPNSLLEAMACALAPVVTDIPANRPWIGDGENGFLFPTGDYHTLASRILTLLKDSRMREDFGRRSREVVQRDAEEAIQMAGLEAIYRELVG